MPVDRPAITGAGDGVVVVVAGEQPDVVDLRDAAGEQLDGPSCDVAVVVAVERGVVRAVELVDVEFPAVRAPTGSG